MSASTARQRAESQLRYLAEQTHVFEPFHAGNFRLHITDFCELFERDDVVGILRQVLHGRVPRSAADWYAEAHRTGVVPELPADPAAAMAQRYALIRAVRLEKVDLRHFVANLFPGSHLNEKLANWKRLVVHPFGEDCRTLAREVVPRLGDSDWVDLEAVLAAYLDGPFQETGFGPRPWDDDDDRRVEAGEPASGSEHEHARTPPPEPPPPTGPAESRPAEEEPASLEDDLGALEARIDALDAPDRGDLLQDARALRLETHRAELLRPRCLARLDALARRPDLAPVCARVRRHFAPGP